MAKYVAPIAAAALLSLSHSASAFDSQALARCVPGVSGYIGRYNRPGIETYGNFYATKDGAIYFIGLDNTYDVDKSCFDRLAQKPAVYPMPSGAPPGPP